jgi:Integrase core domain
VALHCARQTAADGFIESFNGRLRDELLNETLFRSLPHARAALEAWWHDYNAERTHSKLGWDDPSGLCQRSQRRGHPQDRNLKSIPDSRYRWMKNRGHVNKVAQRQFWKIIV